jgi:hypothetical protein
LSVLGLKSTLGAVCSEVCCSLAETAAPPFELINLSVLGLKSNLGAVGAVSALLGKSSLGFARVSLFVSNSDAQ